MLQSQSHRISQTNKSSLHIPKALYDFLSWWPKPDNEWALLSLFVPSSIIIPQLNISLVPIWLLKSSLCVCSAEGPPSSSISGWNRSCVELSHTDKAEQGCLDTQSGFRPRNPVFRTELRAGSVPRSREGKHLSFFFSQAKTETVSPTPTPPSLAPYQLKEGLLLLPTTWKQKIRGGGGGTQNSTKYFFQFRGQPFSVCFYIHKSLLSSEQHRGRWTQLVFLSNRWQTASSERLRYLSLVTQPVSAGLGFIHISPPTRAFPDGTSG